MRKVFFIAILSSVLPCCINKGDSYSNHIYISDSSLWRIEDVDSGCFLVEYKGTETNIIIPESVDGKKVLGMKGGIIKIFDKNYDVSLFGGPEKSSLIKSINFSFAKYLKEIGVFSFLKCTDLKEIIITNNVEKIGDGAFMFCKNLETVYIPNNVNNMGIEIFWGCNYLKNVTIPTNISKIPSSTFAYCTSLKSINIPNNIKSIGTGAFMYCSFLKDINTTNDITEIGADAFRNCVALDKIHISSRIATLFSYTFYNCSSLNNVIIPNSVENISLSCFEGCKSLHTITLRASFPLTSFGINIFNNTPIKNGKGTIYQPLGVDYKTILKDKVSEFTIFLNTN